MSTQEQKELRDLLRIRNAQNWDKCVHDAMTRRIEELMAKVCG